MPNPVRISIQGLCPEYKPIVKKGNLLTPYIQNFVCDFNAWLSFQ